MVELSRLDLNIIDIRRLIEIIREDMEEEKLTNIVNVSYEIVSGKFNEMLKKNIIYSCLGLDMRKIGYVLSFFWIRSKEIYRIIKTFSNFNIITALASTQNDRYLLHMQYPGHEEMKIIRILDKLDSEHEMFRILRVHNNRGIPYDYYFEKEKKRSGISLGRNNLLDEYNL